MTVQALVQLVIYLIIIGVILGLLVYLGDISPIIEPWKGWLRWVVIAVAVIILIMLLLQLIGGGGLPRIKLGLSDRPSIAQTAPPAQHALMPPPLSLIR